MKTEYVALEHHPNDSRIRLIDDDICQSLTSRMGTGGGNVPLIIQIKDEAETIKGNGNDTDRFDRR